MAEDVGHLAPLDHERALPGGEIVGRADAREHAVDHADDGALGRDERAHLRHEDDERHLPHIGRFTGHVRAGDDGRAAVLRAKQRVVRHEQAAFEHLLNDRVAALFDLDLAAGIHHRQDVAVLERGLP